MYSQASKASSWGTCETAKHNVFQVPKGVKNPASNLTFWRPKDNVQSSTQSLALSEDLKTMYSQAPWGNCETAKHHSLVLDTCETAKHHVFQVPKGVKHPASQAPKASFWGTCETAKHHIFEVPKGVKNRASNVTFSRPKDNVQSSTQSLVLGHLRNSQTPYISGPKRCQKPSL